MNSRYDPVSPPVIALLEDSRGGLPTLELGARLAAQMQRDLQLVFVENTRYVGAAELPLTRVLSHDAASWVDLRPADVERGFRAQAARLRELAAPVARSHAVNWSMRVVRGDLQQAARQLGDETDLMLLAAQPVWTLPSLGKTEPQRRRPHIAISSQGGGAGERARRIAATLAQALNGALDTTRLDTLEWLARAAKDSGVGRPRPDILVLPRTQLGPATLERLSCLVLFVGESKPG